MDLFWYCYYRDDNNIVETFIPCDKNGCELFPDDIKTSFPFIEEIFIKILKKDWSIFVPNWCEKSDFILNKKIFPTRQGVIRTYDEQSNQLLIICPVNKKLIKIINEELSIYGINLDHLF